MHSIIKRAQKHTGSARSYAVVAWGQNNHGQCGVPSHAPALLTPQEVSGLAGHPLLSLVAGKNHSAAITADTGDAYTFGCGKFGKLGLGRTDPAYVPARIEALVGRAKIIGAALGDQHSLFLNEHGAVHACGVSTDAGFDALDLHIEAYAERNRSNISGMVPGGNLAHGNGGGGISIDLSSFQPGNISSSSSKFSGNGGFASGGAAISAAAAAAAAAASESTTTFVPQHELVPLIDHRTRITELGFAQRLYTDDLRGIVMKDSSGRHYEASSTTGLLGANDAGGHHFSIPVRLGAAAAMLRSYDTDTTMQALAACGGTGGSIALSKQGLPMQLKVPRRWAAAHQDLAYRHAALLLPTEPCSLLTKVIEDGGGAVQITAGSGFFAALLESGRVVLWLNDSIASVTGRSVSEPKEEKIGPVTLRALGNTFLAEYIEFPKMKAIAANHTSLLMTDGSSVWSIKVHGNRGGGSGGGGDKNLSSTNTSKGRPPLQAQRVLHLPDEGITSLSAGGAAAAVVTDAGRLWLWGDVVAKEKAEEIERHAEEKEGFGHWSYSRISDQPPSATAIENLIPKTTKGSSTPAPWWPGLGSKEPMVVPGLHGVKKVALGAGHALVEVA
jgi:alpha-tubulin suppressor-like RCC1 family protein